MRRFLLATGLGSLLLAGASAQIELRQDDGGTDFTSRGSIGGTLDGWSVERADIWGIQEVPRFFTVYQDQNCSTLEIWALALLGEATPGGVADETNVIASTGTFLSATNGSTGACAWIYTVTLTTPLAVGANPCATLGDPTSTGDGLFVAAFMPSNGAWVADGTSCHISIFNAGSTAEIPNGIIAAQYPPTTPGQGPAAVFGSEIPLGSGGGAATTYSGSWRIWNRQNLEQGGAGVVYDVRCGTEESPQSAGLYTSLSAAGPINRGMAAKYPDFINQSGTAPAREDNLDYATNSNDLIGGIEQLFLAESTLRCGIGIPPIDIPGQGRFELDPTSVLFANSAGLHPAAPVVAATVNHKLDLDASGIRPVFASIPAGGGALPVNYQAVRIDLATGDVRISSMRSWLQEW